jgi:light-regulated signal transduction histidine kinase (bacteriophytochrome)
MSQSIFIDAQNANMTNHEQNLFTTPGSIQPHGVLIALIETELEILQVSNNTKKYLGIESKDLLGQNLSAIFDHTQIQIIRKCLSEGGGSVNPIKLCFNGGDRQIYFDGILQKTQQGIILELEPTNTQAEVSFLSFYSLARNAIAKMQQSPTVKEFLQSLALGVRQITGFDRVMIYEFDPSGAGCVVAEAKREELNSYLGLHYPATDIPTTVRELYLNYLLRYIPDLQAKIVELIPEIYPLDGQPLDLSHSLLRSVDPCCVEFHTNMGSRALFVVSLIKEGKLWGLISCHHQSIKYLPYEIRTACEFLGQFIGLELANKVDRQEAEYIVKIKSLVSQFVKSISEAKSLKEALINPKPRLLELVNATGAAVCLGEEIALIGDTPTVEEIKDLITWADSQIEESLFHTDCLGKVYPQAKSYRDRASGLLVLRISQVRSYYVLWFRPEVIKTINWAGNPQESLQLQKDGTVILSPRNSFAKWEQIVRLTSLPWQECELDSAFNLRNAIVGIVLNKADELARINQELELRNKELDSFAFAASHDLKEPLRGIYNYSTILLEDYGDRFDGEGINYLQTLLRLTKRMDSLIDVLMRFSQLGKAQLNFQETDLNEVVERAIEVFRASRQDENLSIHIPRSLPRVRCDPVLISEVFANTIINAFKYNDKSEPWIEIGYLSSEAEINKQMLEKWFHFPIFYIKDNGIGIQTRHLETVFRLFKRLHPQNKYGGGTGAGLTIAKTIIERHGGKIWVESIYGQGSTFYFTLN